MIQSILVIGATGDLGLPVTRELVKAGFEVLAMVRNPDEAAKILPKEVELVQGDLRITETIERAVLGVDAVYFNLSIRPQERKSEFHTELQGLENFYKASKYASLQKVIYLSSMLKDYKSDWWVFEVKRQAIKLIKNQEIPYTIFYPSSFMETIDKKLLIGDSLMLIGQSQYPMYWIAAEDYGRQVAMSFKIHHQENKEFYVQGEEGLSLLEAAKKFTSHCPKKIKMKQFPVWFFRVLGFLSVSIRYGLLISEAMNNFEEEFLSEKTWEELGKPEISIEEYAKGFDKSR